MYASIPLLALLAGLSSVILADQGHWFQCGGQNWNGGTQCSGGWTCQVQNPYYSQCLPAPGMPDAPEDMGTQPSSSPAETNTGGAPIQTAKSFHSEEGDEDEDTCDAEDDEEPDTKSTTTTTNPNTIQHANSNPNAKSDVKPADSFLANPPVPVVSQPASQAAPAPSSTAPAAAGASSGAPVVAQGSGDKTNLATTTHYDSSGGPGACGCDGGWQAPGSGTLLTAAASFPIYGDAYCGDGCGTCYKLTNQGYGPVANSGASPDHKGDSITVMITNSCPVQGNEQWCSSPNQYGYGHHFDIAGSSDWLGWGNVVVEFEKVGCKDSAPSLVQSYGQCKCAAQRPAQKNKRSVKVRRQVLDGGELFDEEEM